MDNNCRICLRSSEDLKNIFGLKKLKNEPCLTDMIMECTNRPVNPDDTLPKNICTKCIRNIRTAFRFKRRFERSNKLLRELISFESEYSEAAEENSEYNEEQRSSHLKITNMEAIKTKVHIIESDDEEVDDCDSELDFFESDDDEIIIIGTTQPDENNTISDEEELTDVRKKSIENQLLENTVKSRVPNEKSQDTESVNVNEENVVESRVQDYTLEVEEEPTVHPITQSESSYSNSNVAITNYLVSCPNGSKRIKARHGTSHKNAKTFWCPNCPEKFNTADEMKEHYRIHSNETPFRCHKCPERFETVKELENHNQNHSNKLPHKCPYCPRRFTWKAEMINHSLVHTNKKV